MSRAACMIGASLSGAVIGGAILFCLPLFAGFGTVRHLFLTFGLENKNFLFYASIPVFCAVGSFLVDFKDWGGTAQACACSLSCAVWALCLLIMARWVSAYPIGSGAEKTLAWGIALSFAAAWGTPNLIMRYCNRAFLREKE